MRQQRGVAIVQVLLISFIISMLMVQVGLSARDNVSRAALLESRARSGLHLHSVESELAYSLLTHPLRRGPAAEDPYARNWNFLGQPFEVGAAVIKIQDESGLARIPMFGARSFERLLLDLAVSPEAARELSEELIRYQYGGNYPKLGDDEGAMFAVPAYPLQSVTELRQLKGMEDWLYRRLAPLVTTYPAPGFNPTTAPEVLLRPILAETQIQAVRQFRSSGELNRESFWKLTGLEKSERLIGTPGPGLRIEVSLASQDGEAASAIYTLSINPYLQEAVAVWESDRKHDPGMSGF